MKTYIKHYKCSFAYQRYFSELSAYREQFTFWTYWASGWSNPTLISANDKYLKLELTEVTGIQCCWNDAELIALRLCAAINTLVYKKWSAACTRRSVLDKVTNFERAKYGLALNEIVSYFEKVQPVYFRIQGDMKPDNVYKTGGIYSVVDWELSRWGTVHEEVGSLLANALLSEIKKDLAVGFTDYLITVFKVAMPARVAVALAIIDLLRQANREYAINDIKRANLRYSAADIWMSKWF